MRVPDAKSPRVFWALMVLCVSSALAGLACLALPGCQMPTRTLEAVGPSFRLITREFSLGKIQGKDKPGCKDFRTSPYFRRVAYTAYTDGGKWYAVVDGVAHAAFDESEWENTDAFVGCFVFIFSPDGRRLAYAAKRGVKWVVVLDGVHSREYDEAYNPMFSPNSQHFVFVARRGDSWFCVVDGIEQKAYTDIGIGETSFSPDSKRLAYVARQGRWVDREGRPCAREPGRRFEGKACVVVNGVEGKWNDDMISRFFFSPNSKRLAYWCVGNSDPEKPFRPVLDGNQGPAYEKWGQIVFAPNSRRVAWMGARKGKWFVVVDGKEEQPYEEITIPVFSPDSTHVAYWGRKGEKAVVVLDETESVPYDNKGPWYGYYRPADPVFSPDSKRVAWVGQRKGKQFAVVDGVEARSYGRTWPLTFTEDSKHVIHMGQDWSDACPCLLLDGQEIARDIIAGPVWSPDFKHLAFGARRGDKFAVVFDGKEGELHDEIKCPDFPPDFRHVAYWARDGDTWAIYVNGVAGPPYDLPADYYYASALTFSGPRTLNTLAVRDGELLRIEVEIKAP